ncbi:unnamed protein product, partial [Tetraodon nigroviridis]
YAISRDEHTFPEAARFLPERWLRDGHRRGGPNAFGTIPFGFGVRGCVGRRIAELEMYLFLFHLMRHFEIKPDPQMGELKSICRTVLIPDKPLSLYFLDRRKDFLQMYQHEVEEKAKENLKKVRISGCGGEAGWRRHT